MKAPLVLAILVATLGCGSSSSAPPDAGGIGGSGGTSADATVADAPTGMDLVAAEVAPALDSASVDAPGVDGSGPDAPALDGAGAETAAGTDGATTDLAATEPVMTSRCGEDVSPQDCARCGVPGPADCASSPGGPPTLTCTAPNREGTERCCGLGQGRFCACQGDTWTVVICDPRPADAGP